MVEGAAVAALVEFAHAALALRFASRQALLDLGDHLVVDALEQPVRLAPCLIGGVPRDDVQPDAEP